MKKRLDFIDASKGIGILLVVFAHLLIQMNLDNSLNDLIIDGIYQFHMPLFFVLSGYTMELSIHKYKGNAYKKIQKSSLNLLGIYFLWTFVYLIFSLVRKQPISIIEWFYATFTLRGRAPLWFLAALFLGENVYVYMRQYLSKVNTNIQLVGMFIVSIVATLLYSKIQVSSMIVSYPLTTIIRLFPTILCFYIGSFLCQKKIDKPLIFGSISMIIMSVLTILFRNQVNMHIGMFGNVFLFYGNAIFGSVGLILLTIGFCKLFSFRLLPAIGKASLGIMILHYPSCFPFFQLTNYIGKGIIGMSITFVVTILITYYLTIFIRKYKNIV